MNTKNPKPVSSVRFKAINLKQQIAKDRIKSDIAKQEFKNFVGDINEYDKNVIKQIQKIESSLIGFVERQ